MSAPTRCIRTIGPCQASQQFIFSPLWVIVAVILLLLAPTTVIAQSSQKKATKQPVSGTVTPECLGCGGGDTSPPTVSFSPNGGTFSTSSITDTISWCDNQSLSQTSRVVQLNGTNVSSTYATGSKSGCLAYATSLVTLSLQSGSNTLYAQISDQVGNTGDNGNTFTYIPPTYTVTVTSDTASVTRNSSVNGSESFTVKNTGNTAGDYTFTLTCPAPAFIVTCRGPDSTHLTSGQATQVWVSYTTGTGPASGNLTLTATSVQSPSTMATGTMAITVNAPTPPPQPFIADATPIAWTGLDRSLCVTVEVVPGVAEQCDAFRITHPLPTITTHNKLRAPTLLYYSDQVYGGGVSANITVPSDSAVPDSIRFSVYSRTWDGQVSVNPIGTPRSYGWTAYGHNTERVAQSGVAAVTGIFRYRLKAEYWHNSNPGWQSPSTVDGEMLQTYRRADDFGAGWWLAGVEQLVLGQGGSSSRPDSIVAWIGGDGSMQKYVWQQTVGTQDIYLAAHEIDRPDTLIKDSSLPNTPWVRHGENNLRVYFDSYGRHTLTVNRLSDTTRFAWKAGGAARLDTIVVPGNLAYVFGYDSGDRLMTVTAPPAGTQPRVVQFARGTVNGGPTYGVRKITDVDGDSVTFTWTSWSGGDYFYGSRADRRGTTTTLNWDPWGPGLSSASTPDGLGNTVSHQFQNALNIGMNPSSPPVLIDSVYTRYTDPRGNQTKFWLSSLGAPVKVVDAIARTTTVQYADARFPGLPTEMVAPSGFVTGAWYNARGLADSTVAFSPYGDGRNAAKKYVWDGKWANVVTTTLPEGEVTRDSIDQQSGNVLWAEMGGDTTKFHYDVAGTVDSVLTSDGAYDKYAYDALGNLDWHRRPNGYITKMGRDNIGREIADTVETEDSLPNITKHSYDVVGRDSLSLSYRDTDTLEVRTFYNADGLPLSVRQRALPNRARAIDGSMIDTVSHAFTYDALGRKLSEISGGIQVDTWQYDVAGNVLNSSREMGNARMSYDSLNRPTVRSGGADSARFTYDPSTGGLASASNVNAVITRTYYPAGALKGDTEAIIGPRGTDYGPHGLDLSYDREGRRTQLAGVATMQYTYDPRTGQLATITDGNGMTYRYHYDLRGNIDSLIRRENQPDKLVETRSYDSQSRLHERIVPGFLDDIYTYDGLDRIVNTPEAAMTYDGLGHVTAANTVFSETFSFDAMGNRLSYKSSGGKPPTPNDTDEYEPASQRLSLEWNKNALGHDSTTYYYNWGNLTQTDHHSWFSTSVMCGTDSGYVDTQRNNLYGFDNKIVQTSSSYDSVFVRNCDSKRDSSYSTQETYGYDPLGRRVWARVVYGSACGLFDPSTGCSSTVTTTVWDGNSILMESRLPADTGAMEASGDVGAVVYVNGAELDKPLAVLGGHGVLPVPNWKGTITTGGCPTTLCSTSDVTFAQSNGAVYGGPGYPRLSPHYYGSLIQGMQDQSGYVYQRNRYLNPSTGQFTQEDPLGLAGGLNVYGFAGGDPVNYSDPFGLCPYGSKPNEKVSDCPKDALGNGMRLLRSQGGAAGRAAIHTIVTHHISIVEKSGAELTAACGNGIHGCTQGSKMTLDASADAEDMATRVTHEATHVRMPNADYATQGEPTAWGNALTVYGRLRTNNGTSTFYEPQYQWWKKDPNGFRQALCKAAGGGSKC